MHKLKKGDLVEHRQYGDGIIRNLVTNDTVADVKFRNITTYVTVNSLHRKRVAVETRSSENTHRQRVKTNRIDVKNNLNCNTDSKSNNTTNPLKAKGLSDNENLINIKRKLEGQKRQRLDEEHEEKERVKKEAELELKRKEEILKARKSALIKRIKNTLESNFLEADKRFKSDQDSDLIGTEQYQELDRKSVV